MGASESTTKAVKQTAGDVVVLPIDGSSTAEKAFEYYVKHMHRPENTVKVIHCYDPPMPPAYYFQRPRVSPPAEEWAVKIEENQKKTSNLLEKYRSKLAENQITGTVDAEHNHGVPGQTIVNALDKYKADYCVIGSRGLGLIRRTFLGSVSHYVIHHTQVPVTVVPIDSPHSLF